MHTDTKNRRHLSILSASIRAIRGFSSPTRSFAVAVVGSLLAGLVTACGDDGGSRSTNGVDWWSLQPISRPALPAVNDNSRVRTSIDAFIQAKLEERGLTLAPAADRRTLIRRLKFDLHGLPPTPDEVDAFASDRAPDAYERLVDRLLDSPRYGERWARHWLDVVRFAESMGYERDRIRANAWRYRDWVIRAFNDDLPYREFVREQLAGDAIHPDDSDGAVPTGFLVTGPNNDVGNQSALELQRERADELDEIVQNVTSVLLGLTVGCARCHDHKFDPIPTRDYYRIAAVFSGVKFGDRPLEPASHAAKHTEQLAAWDKRTKELNQRLGDIRGELEAIGGLEVNVRRNEERFDPIEARFVRFTITATKDGIEPCIDEIEVYSDLKSQLSNEASDRQANLALASRGAKASASSLLPGYPIHQIRHLNDGLTGNEHSWISNERGGGWAMIELAAPATISRVVWSRDRDGKLTDRLTTEYRLECSLDGVKFRALTTLADRTPPDPEVAARIESLKAERKRLQEQKKSIDDDRAAIDKLPKTWAALSSPPVPLKVLKRGDVLAPGEDAPPGALSAFGLRRLDAALPPRGATPCANESGVELPHFEEGDIGIASDDADPTRRLKLADWIIDPENPLAWRVIVNRIWQHHFGAALVTTPSDFGASGARPSHPELLDWLADEFRSSGGRFKTLHDAIVRSAVYRQREPSADSRLGDSSFPLGEGPGVRDVRVSLDPANRLFWRPNRRRLDAETLRDSILFVSASLDLKLGGPSYRTFNYIEGNIPVYEPLAERPETARRTIYRHLIRTHRQPFLDTFDCPDPSVMTPARTQTTTPLQALSLLNNPFVVEQSRQFAERIARDAGADTASQVRVAFRLALVRDPTDSEVTAAADLVARHGLDSLCRVLFNANEFLYVE